MVVVDERDPFEGVKVICEGVKGYRGCACLREDEGGRKREGL